MPKSHEWCFVFTSLGTALIGIVRTIHSGGHLLIEIDDMLDSGEGVSIGIAETKYN